MKALVRNVAAVKKLIGDSTPTRSGALTKDNQPQETEQPPPKTERKTNLKTERKFDQHFIQQESNLSTKFDKKWSTNWIASSSQDYRLSFGRQKYENQFLTKVFIFFN